MVSVPIVRVGLVSVLLQIGVVCRAYAYKCTSVYFT
jgi:hypothetical protein